MPAGMPRYELRKGKTHRFWEYEVSGACLFARFDDLDGELVETRAECVSAAEANARAEQAVAQQVREGFVLVEED
jgi:predicted DNA-binding WGR domain protein